MKPRKRQWTYSLLNDITHTDLSGSALYPKPELDAVMGLHMLARFKTFTFETDFGWEITALDAYKQLLLPNKIVLDENVLDQAAPDLFINTIRTVNLEEYARHDITFYKHSTFAHQLVEILSKPSDISHLDL